MGKSGANEIRLMRMENPRPLKTGNINCGYAVRQCNACKTEFERTDKCPKCGQTDSYIKHPGKDRFFSIYGVDDKTQGAFNNLYRDSKGVVQPRVLKCTFLKHPSMSVTLGWENWVKSGLFCFNHWKFNEEAYLWDRGPYAERHPKGTLKVVNQPCDPATCPYAVGGMEVEEKGERRFLKAAECKSKIIMDLYLLGMPGLNLFRFTSSGRRTIENCLTGIQSMLMLMKGKWAPLEFELVVEWGEISRPPTKDDKGNLYFQKTTGPIVSIRIPERLDKLTAGSFVQLPGMSEIQSAPHSKREPNELVDHQYVELPEVKSTAVEIPETAKTFEKPPAPETPAPIIESTLNMVSDLVKTYAGEGISARQLALGKAKRAFGLKGRKMDSLSEVEGKKLVKHFEDLIHQKATSDYPLEEDTPFEDITEADLEPAEEWKNE